VRPPSTLRCDRGGPSERRRVARRIGHQSVPVFLRRERVRTGNQKEATNGKVRFWASANAQGADGPAYFAVPVAPTNLTNNTLRDVSIPCSIAWDPRSVFFCSGHEIVQTVVADPPSVGHVHERADHGPSIRPNDLSLDRDMVIRQAQSARFL
jgi:hypothetical protein